MTTITLRPAKTNDFEYLFALHRETLGPYVDQVWGWDDAEQRAYLGRSLDIDSTDVIVVDGADAGRLNVGVDGDGVVIGLIEVAAHLQRRGIGARIVGSLLTAAAAEGKNVRLNVLGVNTGAHRLYRRLGFHDVRREGLPPRVRIQMRATTGVSAGIPGRADPILLETWRRHRALPWNRLSRNATEPAERAGADSRAAPLPSLPAVRLRAARPSDHAFIVEMARHASVIEDRPLPSLTDEDLLAMLPAPGDVPITAEDQTGEPVGAVWTWHHDPALLLDARGASLPELCIAVSPDERGAGIGGLLIEALIARLEGTVEGVCANVHVRNPARRLYERKGFRVVGQGRGELGLAMFHDFR